MAIDVSRAADPTPRPRDRRRARHASSDGVRRVPRGRDRRGRLPGLPPEPGHLRPAPGRPQPDGAGEDPARPGRRPSSSRCSATSPRPTRAAGATSPPARTCSSTSSQLEQTPEVLRLLASVGLTSREACGDTVRNVVGCHLAGACPYEVLDITPVGRGDRPTCFLRNPIAQRLPRKFKINFSGCATDCGQAMFNDVGVIAVSRPLARRHASSPASRCSSPAASARTRTRRRRSRSSRPRGPAADDRGDACARSTTTATATTSCAPA